MFCIYIVRLMDYYIYVLYIMNLFFFVRIVYIFVLFSFMYIVYYRYCIFILYIFIYVYIYIVRVLNSVKFFGVLVGLIFLMIFELFY